MGDEWQLSEIVGGEGASPDTVGGEAGATVGGERPGAASLIAGSWTESAGEVGDGTSSVHIAWTEAGEGWRV